MHSKLDNIFASKKSSAAILFLLSVTFMFVIIFYVEAFSITINSPKNLTYNGSRNINFTFTPVWSGTGDNVSNCSIYTNSNGIWDSIRNFSTTNTPINHANITNNSISWANVTISSDGNFTFNIGCYTSNDTGLLNFSGGVGGSGNMTFFLDSIAPRIILDTPIGSIFLNKQLNITTYESAVFYVNVSDNSTFNTFFIFSRTDFSTGQDINESKNRSMVLDRVISSDLRRYNASFAGLLNFSSNFTGPGSHSVFFCANDSLGRIECSAKADFLIKGINVSEMERQFGSGEIAHQEAGNSFTFSGLDIRFGNGSDVPFSSFMNPTVGNFTFNMNFTSDAGIYIVGASINESSFANAGETNYTGRVSEQARQQAGTGFNSNMTWVDIKKFIPPEVVYAFGIIQIKGLFSKKMFCNGTSESSPNCFTINQCNSSNIGLFNGSTNNIIPKDSACWLTSGFWGEPSTIDLPSGINLPSGFTYFFVDHFSGGLGANDFSQINVTFNAPLFNNTNVTIPASKVINFTLEDINSTGLNLTINNSINVTLIQSGTQLALFSYLNHSSTNLTCITNDLVSLENTTSVTCNATFRFNTSGFVVINVSARDASNNSNPVNLTSSSITIKGVDIIAPVLTIFSPTEGQNSANNISLNLSVKDDFSKISLIGYYLDGNIIPIQLNFSASGLGSNAENLTINRNINFTPGTHQIKFTANDTDGNAVNSSPITFTVTGPIVFNEVNNSIESYIATVFNSNITNVSIRIKTSGIYEDIITTNETLGNTFEILYQINGSINVSLTDINGSAPNWDKINFTPYINQTSFIPGLQNNWTNTILKSVWFNNSIEEVIGKNNSYFGVVVFPLNISVNASTASTSTTQEFWWLKNEDVFTTRKNISQCTSAYTTTNNEPCWNYTSGGKTIIFVPHFSIVLAVNDTTAPTIKINTPNSNTGNQTVSMFEPNITVSSDTVNCKYSVNSSTPVNVTMQNTTTNTNNICIGQTERFKNLNAGYNITFFATDSSGNIGTLVFYLNVSDTTSPNTPNSTSVTSSASTTSATITITSINESVNATVLYSTTIAGISETSSNAVETDFNQTQKVSISGLSENTTYFFNVSICDFNGNCAKNGTFNFTTSTTTSTSSGGTSGGGGGGGLLSSIVISNTLASASKKWDNIQSGTNVVFTIKNEKIAITGITTDFKNTVKEGELKVESLKSNLLGKLLPAKVYQYLQLTRKNIGDLDVSGITLNFRVPLSWLKNISINKSISEDDIVLYRYTTQWDELPTKKIGSEVTYILYQSTTPGFSLFAIGAKGAQEEVTSPTLPTQENETTEPQEPQKTPEEITEKTEVKKPVEEIKEGGGKVRVTLFILIILTIGTASIMLYSMWKKKRKLNKGYL